jgi:hypothetical protein
MRDLIQEWADNGYVITLENYLLQNLVITNEPFNIFFPIEYNNEMVQFTNYRLKSTSSGDSYFLVMIDNSYSFFRITTDYDCDGVNTYGYVISLSDMFQEDFETAFKIGSVSTEELLTSLSTIY